jgi:transcriptional regulator with XRE-family HTH domain
MSIQASLGRKVKELRLKNGISQEKLAVLAGLDRTYISSIEKGDRNVSILVVEKLAKALKVKPQDLF